MDIYERAERLSNKVVKIDNSGSNPPSGFGLCTSCNDFRWHVRMYGSEKAWCDEFNWVRFKKDDPIVRCSFYSKKGQLSMKEMLSMATLINIDKNPLGFSGGKDNIIVTIIPPKEDEDE